MTSCRAEYEHRGLDDITRAGWRHVMFFCFITSEGLTIDFNCIGFYCNKVYLWDSRSVLWTQTLHPSAPPSADWWVDNEWIQIFLWTIPLILLMSVNSVNTFPNTCIDELSGFGSIQFAAGTLLCTVVLCMSSSLPCWYALTLHVNNKERH